MRIKITDKRTVIIPYDLLPAGTGCNVFTLTDREASIVRRVVAQTVFWPTTPLRHLVGALYDTITDVELSGWLEDAETLVDKLTGGPSMDQAANTFLAGPETGADDAPSFRDQVVADLPPLSRFAAYVTADLNDVTGDGTVYNPVFGTEVYDALGDYDHTTGVFTAPCAGAYLFGLNLRLGGVATNMDRANVRIIGTPGTFTSNMVTGNCRDADGYLNLQVVAPMLLALSDTAYAQVRVRSGAKTVDVLAGIGYSWFWGIRLT